MRAQFIFMNTLSSSEIGNCIALVISSRSTVERDENLEITNSSVCSRESSGSFIVPPRIQVITNERRNRIRGIRKQRRISQFALRCCALFYHRSSSVNAHFVAKLRKISKTPVKARRSRNWVTNANAKERLVAQRRVGGEIHFPEEWEECIAN